GADDVPHLLDKDPFPQSTRLEWGSGVWGRAEIFGPFSELRRETFQVGARSYWRTNTVNAWTQGLRAQVSVELDEN
ncbi:MAG: hypothetical protein ABJH20_23690, partial [Rhizobiaceae bacterium]